MSKLSRFLACLLPILCMVSIMPYCSKPFNVVQKKDNIHSLPKNEAKLLVHAYCSNHNTPYEISVMIHYFIYGNPLQYKNKPLPKDLSQRDLSNFNFTGCQFTCTNLTDTNLENAILMNTTCNYVAAFNNKLKCSKQIHSNQACYLEKLPSDLESITKVYPKLNNNAYKAQLLHISSAFVQLPCIIQTNKKEFDMKMQYWSCVLLQLKKVLPPNLSRNLVCSLEPFIEKSNSLYFWQTTYLPSPSPISNQYLYSKFEYYLKKFDEMCNKYQCRSRKTYWGFDWYKNAIRSNIKQLQYAYLTTHDKETREEMSYIAHQLFQSYQKKGISFLVHYLFYQIRIINLIKKVGHIQKRLQCYESLIC